MSDRKREIVIRRVGRTHTGAMIYAARYGKARWRVFYGEPTGYRVPYLHEGKRWNYFANNDLDAARFAASFGIRGYRSLREIAEVFRVEDFDPEPLPA